MQRISTAKYFIESSAPSHAHTHAHTCSSSTTEVRCLSLLFRNVWPRGIAKLRVGATTSAYIQTYTSIYISTTYFKLILANIDALTNQRLEFYHFFLATLIAKHLNVIIITAIAQY